MKTWKPLALIVGAGLMLGMTAGAANRPVMVERAKDYWPASVEAARHQIEAPRAFYEAGPQDLTPATYSYSYRPELDFSASAWPDQTMPAIADLAPVAEPDRQPAPNPRLEQIADRAQAAAEEAIAAAEGVPEAPVATIDTAAPAQVQPIQTAAF